MNRASGGMKIPLTNALVVLMVISFLFQQIIPGYEDALIFYSDRALFDPWRFFTANFAHVNILHLFVNVYSLYVIGNALETRIKSPDLLRILFLGSALIYLEQWIGYSFDLSAYGISSYAVGLGASGGTSALLAAAWLWIPEEKVRVFFIPAKIKHLAMLFFAFEIMMFAIGNTTTAHDAHLLGGLFGLLYAKYIAGRSEEHTSEL